MNPTVCPARCALALLRLCSPRPPSRSFIIFVRQQMALQTASASGNSEGNADLLSYVEFQRKQRMVVRLHKEALLVRLAAQTRCSCMQARCAQQRAMRTRDRD